MSNKKNKKKWVVAATTLATIAALAATFAWFQSKDSVKNHFEGDIAGSDVEVVETFTPPIDWKPGEKVNKDVAILNSGQYNSFIRVSLQETIEKLKNAESKLSSDVSVLEGGNIYLMPATEPAGADKWGGAKVVPTTMVVEKGAYQGTYTLNAKEEKITTDSGTTYRYFSYWDNGKTGEDAKRYFAKVSSYTRAEDGTITPSSTEFKYVNLDATTVTKDWSSPIYAPKIEIVDGKATVVSNSDEMITLDFVNLTEKPTANNWYYNTSDGYFYYVAIVGTQQQTKQLLDSVTLSSDAGNDYSKVKFDLTVNAFSIQAMKEVVNSKDWVNNTNAELKTTMEDLFK